MLLFQQAPQCVKPGILPNFNALAFCDVPVPAAHRTEPTTIAPAKRFHRQRQLKLLFHELGQVDLFIVVKRRAEVGLFNLDITLAHAVRRGQIEQVYINADWPTKSFETATAAKLKLSIDRPHEPEFTTILANIQINGYGVGHPILTFSLRAKRRSGERAANPLPRLLDILEIEVGQRGHNFRLHIQAGRPETPIPS